MASRNFKRCVICNCAGPEGYFTFPKDSNLQECWIQKCPKFTPNKDETKIADSKRVCYRHFAPKEIKITSRGYQLVPGKL